MKLKSDAVSSNRNPVFSPVSVIFEDTGFPVSFSVTEIRTSPSSIVYFFELKFKDNFLMRGVITAVAFIEFFFSAVSLYSGEINLNTIFPL